MSVVYIVLCCVVEECWGKRGYVKGHIKRECWARKREREREGENNCVTCARTGVAPVFPGFSDPADD